ncbi:MFS general substrate transporter [Nemania serpens]|nr:MFS general substrate transporter [Nemania serpens]
MSLPDLDNTPSKDNYPGGLSLALLTGAVAQSTIVGTAIPKITDKFDGLGLVSWYRAAIYKHFPLKETFLTTVVIFEIGSIICSTAPNAVALIVGRAIAGLGSAGISTGGTSIIVFSAEPKKHPTLMGIIGMPYTLVAVAGPLLGGVFSERCNPGATWRWCFYINALIGALVIVVILIFFRLPIAKKHPAAALKEKLLQTGPVGVVLGMSYRWNSSTVVGLLVEFVAILVVLAVWEYYQGEYAMLTQRLFFFAGGYFLLLYLLIYFQGVKGANPIQSGVNNLPLIIAAGVFILAGVITVGKTGHAVSFMAPGAAPCTAGTGLLYTLELHTPSARWIGYQVLLAASTGFPFQNCLNVVHANIKAESWSGMMVFQVLGGAFSVAAAQSAFVSTLIQSLTTTSPTVDPAVVIAVGATQLHSALTPNQVPGIVLAYLAGIKTAFTVGTRLAGAAFILSLACP